MIFRPLALRVTLASRASSLSVNGTHRRTFLTLKDHKYTAHATASGAGRNGRVVSNEDGAAPLDMKLSTPKGLGGNGKGHNPEQLFAAGYAACFLGALQLMAGQAGKKDLAANAKIHTSVHIGEPSDIPGFGIAVDIEVEGVPDEQLIQDAHAACPYSRALSRGAQVTVKSR
ncbi:OsmC-like protein [Gautieria morchelliformis]|nr:OsmC-like protein [Gautieria morchelliformis]